MYAPWCSVLPPLCVIVLAFATQRIRFSLVVGIIVSCLLLHDFDMLAALYTVGQYTAKVTEIIYVHSWGDLANSSNLLLLFFLCMVSVLTELVQFSGGACAYANYALTRLRSARNAQLASILLSSMFFIDDYFSCLSVGSTMAPLTDAFKVPRIRLALLVNIMAGSLTILVPLSSWVAHIVGQVRNSGIDIAGSQGVQVVAAPFATYVSMIPFMFYALIAITCLVYFVVSNSSFGVLATAHTQAQETGNLFGGRAPLFCQQQAQVSGKASLVDFFLPIAVLFATIFGMVCWLGDAWLCGGNATFAQALMQANLYVALCCGGLAANIVASLLSAWSGASLYALSRVWMRGLYSIMPTLATLLLLWIFASLLRGPLATGNYLASLFGQRLPLAFLPALLFAAAALVTSCIGSAWGSIGMFVPLAVPMVVQIAGLQAPIMLSAVPILIPVLAAIVSGALVGNHLSPLADVMLMTAASVGAYHWDLVQAHIAFTVPVFIASLGAFLLAGVLVAQGFSLSSAALAGFVCGALLGIGIHRVWHHLSHRGRDKQAY